MALYFNRLLGGFKNSTTKTIAYGAASFYAFYFSKDYVLNIITENNLDKNPADQIVLQEYDPGEDNRQKCYLITGPTSGLGKELVRQLSNTGKHKIYMLSRNMKKCEDMRLQYSNRKSDLYCVHCDLSSLESVRNCANEIKSKEKRIDGLVNNAGVLLDPKPATKDGIETHWSVNHLGHYLLTRLLIDELELGGRVLFATNLDARKAYDGIDYNLLDDKTGKNKKYAFYQSQLANQMMIKSLSTELKPRFITVNGVYPGAVLETDFRQNVVYNLEKGFGYFLFICKKDQAIKTMLHMLVSKDMIGTTGKQFWNMNEMAFSSGASHEKEEKLKLIDDYFCGLKSREEISKLIGINEDKETAS